MSGVLLELGWLGGHILIVEVVRGQDEQTHGGLSVTAGGPSVSTSAPVVPPKFSVKHVAVCFGAGGQLVLVCPHHPAEGQPAHVELHSLEVSHSLAPQPTFDLRSPCSGTSPFAPRGANAICHPNSILSSLPICCGNLVSSSQGLLRLHPQPLPVHCF